MKDKTGIRDRAGVTISDKSGNVVKTIFTDARKDERENDLSFHSKESDESELDLENEEYEDDEEDDGMFDIEEIPVDDENSASNPEEYQEILDEEE